MTSSFTCIKTNSNFSSSREIDLGFMFHLTQNRSFHRRFPQPISRLSAEKQNQTQQKQACIHKKYTTT